MCKVTGHTILKGQQCFGRCHMSNCHPCQYLNPHCLISIRLPPPACVLATANPGAIVALLLRGWPLLSSWRLELQHSGWPLVVTQHFWLGASHKPHNFRDSLNRAIGLNNLALNKVTQVFTSTGFSVMQYTDYKKNNYSVNRCLIINIIHVITVFLLTDAFVMLIVCALWLVLSMHY